MNRGYVIARRAGWTYLAAAAFAGFEVARLLAAASQSPPPNSIVVQELKLVDSSGVTRAWLGFSKSGSPKLEFFDAQSRPTAVLGSADRWGNDGEPGFLQLNQRGLGAITLGAVDASPGLYVRDDAGKQAIRMRLELGKFPDLAFMDRHENIRATLNMFNPRVPDDATGSLAVQFELGGPKPGTPRMFAGHTAISCEADAEGGSSIRLNDVSNHASWAVSVDKNGSATVGGSKR